ncbi:MAG: GDSL family lipase [Selenomonadaceae bacterium]|nr:GDSL family lipase [Selenomonadaceae bacterium]
MKHFFVFFLLISLFSSSILFLCEKMDFLALSEIPFNPRFEINSDGTLMLSWDRPNYPVLYKIETFQKTTGILEETEKFRSLYTSYTYDNAVTLQSVSLPIFYRITAYGIFGRVQGPSDKIDNPLFPSLIRPISIYDYDENKKASLMPFLVWHKVPNGVCYELEILSGNPDSEGGITLSKGNHLFSTRQIFTNGYQVDLRPFQNNPKLYWRVRALGLHHEPIGEFSETKPICVDKNLPIPDRPLINDFDLMPNFEQPLYPAFDFIPLNGINRYEVELTTKLPEVENNKEPSKDRAWFKRLENAITAYDEYPRPFAGPYYWRVRAIDANGNTIGSYSNTKKFEVKSREKRVRLAVFGDSITHGGGAVSYSPASLEYSYNTYLDIPAINLGRSGDTSTTSKERFTRDVLFFKPKNLLILTGTNSLRTSLISADDVISDIDAMERLAKENDIRPIFLTLMPINPENIMFAFQIETDPKWKEKLKKINDHIKTKPYHIDLEPFFYDGNGKLSAEFSIDGLHPDIKGKMLMAEIVNLHKNLIRE